MSGCSVTGRLVAINQELDSLAWDGLEERRLMEAKRAKLLDQLGETKLLWANIERRSDTVVSQVKNIYHCRKIFLTFPKNICRWTTTLGRARARHCPGGCGPRCS